MNDYGYSLDTDRPQVPEPANLDPQLFSGLPAQCVSWMLTRVDVATEQIPDVGIDSRCRRPVDEQHQAVFDHGSGNNNGRRLALCHREPVRGTWYESIHSE